MADLHELRAAYSRRDPAADSLRRELARTIGDGVPYYELLCLVAEQAWSRGEQCRAESLLRRASLIADSLDHVPMMCLDDRWLIVTSIASGGGKLSARCAVLVDAIMAHHNRGLAASAPYDPNFIGLERVDARLVGSTEVGSLAAALRRSAWSPSPLYVIDGARFAPLSLKQLHAIVGN